MVRGSWVLVFPEPVDDFMAGIKTFVLQTDAPLVAAHPSPGSASGLDHLVINTPNPERAVANYGARLGLRFALDRTAEQWKTRFLFFRLGGLTLEVIKPGACQTRVRSGEIVSLPSEPPNM
ncbi:MAG: hypothetical protein AAFQ12_12540, partial [Pseudomonadota bacterium]